MSENEPHSALNSQNTFVEGPEDVTGYLAQSLFISSINSVTFKTNLDTVLVGLTDHDIRAFRAYAKNFIDNYVERVVANRSDELKYSIVQVTYNDIMRTNYDRLLSEQQVAFEKILREVGSSSNPWRQIIISVVASFVFGVMVVGFSVLDNPFKPSFDRSHQTGSPQ